MIYSSLGLLLILGSVQSYLKVALSKGDIGA